MEITEIIQLVVTIAVFVGTVVGFVVALVKAIKKYKSATTEAEKQEALNDMKSAAEDFIADAEEVYEAFASSLVSAVSTSSSDSDTTSTDTTSTASTTSSIKTGSLKKKIVMSDLLLYANNNDYEFDSEYWSNEIDSLIDLTNKVNVNKTVSSDTETETTETETTTTA